MVEADDRAAAVDIGDGSMTICSKHPYKNNRSNPGGICAFCLQDKLGKLVSSSLPIAVFPSSSTGSASYSLGSESSNNTASASASASVSTMSEQSQRKPAIPFLTYRRKTKNQAAVTANGSVMYKRSKSTTTTPSRKLLDGCESLGDQKRSWLWWYNPKRGSGKTTPYLHRTRGEGGVVSTLGTGGEMITEGEEDDDHYNNNRPGSHVATSTTTSFGRKVSRSRSVGCGSRSFSGDFFERISTGLGDCTLRGVESQREGNNNNNKSKVADSCMKERVRCGGIFGGFIMTSSSSSSSSSSHWLPHSAVNAQMVHGKGRSWAWAFASPIRAFSKPASEKDARNSNRNAAPNLFTMPSLLSVSSNR